MLGYPEVALNLEFFEETATCIALDIVGSSSSSSRGSRPIPPRPRVPAAHSIKYPSDRQYSDNSEVQLRGG